ncbi:hypothetical protein [Komagataeibacter diospyri]|uniref:hypothetical protein n=1 Tax=Komagataeibacter diospyri TaxID=1932662 RepID=UPI001D03875D|nr:hypothetical protein [Komagataeibacter diospyri]
MQRTGQPARTPANQNLLSPHRQNRLDLNHHEAPPHNRKAGGHVLLKHVDPTEAYIERRFTACRQLSRMMIEANCTAARKVDFSLS